MRGGGGGRARIRDDEREDETDDAGTEQDENEPDVLRGFGSARQPAPVRRREGCGEHDERDEADDAIDED
jgi:hypothetical protein